MPYTSKCLEMSESSMMHSSYNAVSTHTLDYFAHKKCEVVSYAMFGWCHWKVFSFLGEAEGSAWGGKGILGERMGRMGNYGCTWCNTWEKTLKRKRERKIE